MASASKNALFGWTSAARGFSITSQRIRNRHSVSLESINLYRVEKHFNVAQGRPANASSLVSNSNAPPTVRVYFFKTNHPIDLEFPSAVECRRFLEQAALHRKHAVVWAPSLCRHSRREALLRVFDESAFKKSGAASPNELPGFTASRVSHEVIRFWAGCLDMAEQHALAPSVELREALRAGEADIFVIGVINISPGQMKLELGKQLSSLFESMCGSDFYLVLNSASEVNAFANVPDCRSKSGGANDACLLLARRSLLSKFCHFSCRSVSDPLQPMNRGIYVSFHMQESSFGFLVANLGGVVEDIMDTEEKTRFSATSSGRLAVPTRHRRVPTGEPERNPSVIPTWKFHRGLTIFLFLASWAIR